MYSPLLPLPPATLLRSGRRCYSRVERDITPHEIQNVFDSIFVVFIVAAGAILAVISSLEPREIEGYKRTRRRELLRVSIHHERYHEWRWYFWSLFFSFLIYFLLVGLDTHPRSSSSPDSSSSSSKSSASFF